MEPANTKRGVSLATVPNGELVIRRVGIEDLELLDRCLPPTHSRTEHLDRLRAQDAGEIEYLAALLGEVPVGQVVLCWNGFKFGPLPSLFPGLTLFRSLRVWPAEHRGRGIGGALVAEVERLSLKRGYPGIGLGVEVENVGARRWYRRLGYVEWDGGPLTERLVRLNASGEPEPYDEVFTVMTKRLGEA